MHTITWDLIGLNISAGVTLGVTGDGLQCSHSSAWFLTDVGAAFALRWLSTGGSPVCWQGNVKQRILCKGKQLNQCAMGNGSRELPNKAEEALHVVACCDKTGQGRGCGAAGWRPRAPVWC